MNDEQNGGQTKTNKKMNTQKRTQHVLHPYCTHTKILWKRFIYGVWTKGCADGKNGTQVENC